MAGVVWEDPPPCRGGPGSAVWLERLTPLMEHPKRWALLGDFNVGAAGNLRARTYRMPPGRFEFAARRVPTSGAHHANIYARYLGPEDES